MYYDLKHDIYSKNPAMQFAAILESKMKIKELYKNQSDYSITLPVDAWALIEFVLQSVIDDDNPPESWNEESEKISAVINAIKCGINSGAEDIKRIEELSNGDSGLKACFLLHDWVECMISELYNDRNDINAAWKLVNNQFSKEELHSIFELVDELESEDEKA